MSDCNHRQTPVLTLQSDRAIVFLQVLPVAEEVAPVREGVSVDSVPTGRRLLYHTCRSRLLGIKTLLFERLLLETRHLLADSLMRGRMSGE